MRIPAARAVVPLTTDLVFVPDNRLHALDEASVVRIAKSIDNIGQQTPVTVFAVRQDDKTRFVLVAGAHRLEACRRLGKDVWAVQVDSDDPDLKRWELEENFARSSLTPDEFTSHVGELIRLETERGVFGAHEPKLKTASNPKGAGRPASPTSNRGLAAKTGASKDKVGRAKQKLAAAGAPVPEAEPTAPAPKPAPRSAKLRLQDAWHKHCNAIWSELGAAERAEIIEWLQAD